MRILDFMHCYFDNLLIVKYYNGNIRNSKYITLYEGHRSDVPQEFNERVVIDFSAIEKDWIRIEVI